MPSADLKKPLGTGEQTMSRDKQQIELERWEMAESLTKNFHINGEGWDASDFEWAAHCQEEGYRKASYVAREIFDDIESGIYVKMSIFKNFNLFFTLKVEMQSQVTTKIGSNVYLISYIVRGLAIMLIINGKFGG